MRGPAARLAAPIIVAAACLAAFPVIGVAVAGRGPLGVDGFLRTLVAGLPVPADAWAAVTSLGDRFVMAAVGGVLVLVQVVRRRYREALALAIGLAGAIVLADVAKGAFGRPRPVEAGPHAPTDFAYPSGHTIAATVAYGAWAVHAWRPAPHWWGRRAAAAAIVLLPTLVGLSRVGLGVHHPTDVIGGWLAGSAIVALVAAAWSRGLTPAAEPGGP